MKIEQIAKVCHQANKAFCESMGDHSQVDWEIAPENLRQSAINGVKFHINNPLSTPEDSHNNWLNFKKAEGWIYGEEKNMDLKTHPCMRPYSELPEFQQKKDYLFKYIVNILSK